MPKVVSGGSYNKKYKEEDIVKALTAIENGMSQREAAKIFHVPRATLQFRSSQKFNNKTSHGPKPILTSEEETLLENWILASHKKGFPLRMEDVQASVKHFLDASPRENPFNNNLPGKGWYAAFFKRHPKITLRTSEGITAASSVVAESDIRKWFSSVEAYLSEKHLTEILEDPMRIYNGDETCFLLCPNNKKVLAPKGAKNVYEIQHHPKNNITVMFTFSARGDVTPPMIIYAYKRLPSEILNSVPDEWGIGCSDNGWMKNKLFYEYIGNVLHPYLEKSGIKFPVLLFVDGHCTHLTYEISELCSKLQIILIALYPNSTRIMQPADVAVFKPLKEGWKKAVLNFRREHPTEVVTKEKFAPVLKTVVDKIQPQIIQHGFQACGLYPWNPSAIDYSKCLGKKKESTNNENSSYKSNVITFEIFKNTVGEEKMRALKNFNEENIYSEDFLVLFHLYEEFSKQKQSKETLDEAVSHEVLNEHLLVEPININLNHDNVQFVDNERVNYLTEGTFDIENIPILLEECASCELQIPSTSMDSKEDDTLNKSVLSDFITWPTTPQRKGKRESEKLPFVLTSSIRKNAEKKKISVKKEIEALKEKRKAERLEKRQLKQELLIKKNKHIKGKKRIKKENSAITENNAISLTILNSTLPNILENNKTETNEDDIKENRGPETVDITHGINNNDVPVIKENYTSLTEYGIYDKSKAAELNEKTLINLPESLPESENIIIVPEKTKRRLFTDRQIEKKAINITSVITLKPFAPNPFRNKTIYTGLCFTCVLKISRSQYGVKCLNCTRTYHIKCILKHKYGDFTDNQFICNVCSKNK